jgi:hypothetical protein
MYNFPPTKETKANRERSLEEFSYQTTLDWKFMKKLKSETEVRHWHVKVHNGQFNDKGRPVFEDFNIHQVWYRKEGERLTAYRATKSGRAIDIRQPLFSKEGEDWLHGVEYLLRVLEGQDISRLDLRKQQES